MSPLEDVKFALLALDDLLKRHGIEGRSTLQLSNEGHTRFLMLAGADSGVSYVHDRENGVRCTFMGREILIREVKP